MNIQDFNHKFKSIYFNFKAEILFNLILALNMR